MRPEFFKQLYQLMKDNPNVWALTGDLGFGGFDQIMKDFPDRFLNCGASEFAMCGIAAGLALEKKIVFTYTITPFYLRAFELIRTYIAMENISVIMVGSGYENDYLHDGRSHDATDIPTIFNSLQNINQYYPESKDEIGQLISTMILSDKPSLMVLRR